MGGCGVAINEFSNKLFNIYVREAAKNIQRGGGSLNLASFGRKVLVPPKSSAKTVYPP